MRLKIEQGIEEPREREEGWERIFWSPNLPVPKILKSKPVIILDSCMLFFLFHPHTTGDLLLGATGKLIEFLISSRRALVVVFDFILYETELEEEREGFGRGAVRKGLRQLGVILIRTKIRGLGAAARTIDLLPHKHELLREFDQLHFVDSALIVCACRMAQEGARVYVATTDRAMTAHLERKGIPNLLKWLGILFDDKRFRWGARTLPPVGTMNMLRKNS
ncbi:MAG: hypothetical protein QXR87_04130 [Candidatus Hadarchaeales archaeon]